MEQLPEPEEWQFILAEVDGEVRLEAARREGKAWRFGRGIPKRVYFYIRFQRFGKAWKWGVKITNQDMSGKSCQLDWIQSIPSSRPRAGENGLLEWRRLAPDRLWGRALITVARGPVVTPVKSFIDKIRELRYLAWIETVKQKYKGEKDGRYSVLN